MASADTSQCESFLTWLREASSEEEESGEDDEDSDDFDDDNW